jgi:hypothetical protein
LRAPAHTKARLLLSLFVGYALAIVAGQSTLAHLPTEGKREYLGDNHAQYYQFSSGSRDGGQTSSPQAPTWLQSNVEAADSDFEDLNNSRAPGFVPYIGGPFEVGTIWWALNSETPDTAECPPTFWFACTDYRTDGTSSDRWKSTTYNRSNPSSGLDSHWCQSTAQIGPTDGCIDTRRVTLHEFGHGVGLSRDSNDDLHFPTSDPNYASFSVMHGEPLYKPATNYDLRQLGTCDRLALGILHDVDSFSGVYNIGCVDHLGSPALDNGDIDTTVTQSTLSAVVCIGDSFTFTGTARIVSASVLGELSGNGLAGRLVTIYRRTSGGSYSSYTSATVASGEGGSWSVTIGSSTAASYYYQARYAPNPSDDPDLDGDSSGLEKHVTWSTSC